MPGLKAAVEAGDDPAQRTLCSAAGHARAFALLQTFNALLLASHSATATLEDWCRGRAIRARRVAGEDRPASAEQRLRLQAAPDEAVAYRRVELACGDRVLSEAENWYVPSRLTAAIREALNATDTPFGRAVLDLGPVRDTFAVELFWRPDAVQSADRSGLPGADAAIPWRLLQHRALVYDAGGRPFSEVNETYTSAILDFGCLDADQDRSIA